MEQDTPEVGTESTNQHTEPSFTPIQLKAIEQGWIPKEDFDGDEAEFIDAAEFVRRGELFQRIESQSKELKKVRQALDAFKLHHSKVKEAEYERALKSLQEARKQAFVDGEHERAFALEEKIDEIKSEKATVVEQAREVATDDNEYTSEFKVWVDRNSWYENNDTMRATADTLGLKYHKQGLSPQEVLRKVEAEIRKEFSHKFKNPAAERTQAVESATRSGKTTTSVSMSPEERDIMRKIVATGIMTEAEYIKELQATNRKS
jgi:hypothetical protein